MQKPDGWIYTACRKGQHSQCEVAACGCMTYCGCSCHLPEPDTLTDEELEAMRASLEKR